MARMKLMRNKRDVEVKRIRRDVAQLLQSGDESTARIRVDHVIRDEKTISAYELLEVYCELIIQRLHVIDSQKICPIDLKEAIATVVFAAPRCAYVLELSEVAKQFQTKYGKEFINAALELRPGSGVSPLIIEKLSASSANIEIKVKVLKSIVEENNVKWEAKGFEEETKAPQLVRLALEYYWCCHFFGFILLTQLQDVTNIRQVLDRKVEDVLGRKHICSDPSSVAQLVSLFL